MSDKISNKKSSLFECADGGTIGSTTTLNSVVGVGNVVPAQSAAMTWAEQDSPDCIGSGDLFGKKLYKNSKPVKNSKNSIKKFVIAKKKGNNFVKLKESESFEDINKIYLSLNDKDCKIYSVKKIKHLDILKD